jgi:hypothetical protein
MNEWRLSGIVALWVTLGLHFLLALAGSALVARRLGVPVLLSVGATASALVVLWVALAGVL